MLRDIHTSNIFYVFNCVYLHVHSIFRSTAQCLRRRKSMGEHIAFNDVCIDLLFYCYIWSARKWISLPNTTFSETILCISLCDVLYVGLTSVVFATHRHTHTQHLLVLICVNLHVHSIFRSAAQWLRRRKSIGEYLAYIDVCIDLVFVVVIFGIETEHWNS